jgi:carboxyl-terminal processing protease
MRNLFACLAGIVVGCGIFLFSIKSGNTLAKNEEAAIEAQQKILKEIMELFATKALERPKDLIACAQEIFAMRRNGKCRDRFTYYLSPEDAKRMADDMKGRFAGVGVEITQKDNYVVVVAPMAGTPAEQAGIKPNDIIIKVNDKKISNIEEAVSLMRGEPGTKVKIAIIREKNPKELVFTLTRKEIVIQSVKWSIAPGNAKVGIVKISHFDAKVPFDFFSAFVELKMRKADSVIIDLRNNPGGLLNSAIGVLQYFMESGNIMLTIRERDKQEAIPKNSMPSMALMKNFKILILINNGSASASEIVAGTMKDWGYAIVGEKSYGKGVGQLVFSLSDGSELVLTTFEFLVGNNRVAIRDKGVIPTVEIKRPKEEKKAKDGKEAIDSKKDAQLEEAIKIIAACAKRNDISKNCVPIVKEKK